MSPSDEHSRSSLGEAFRRAVERSGTGEGRKGEAPASAGPARGEAGGPPGPPTGSTSVPAFAEGPLAPGREELAGLKAALLAAGVRRRRGRPGSPKSSAPEGIVLITGPGPRSGKTAVAAGLAGELARDLSFRVLALDADIKRPGLAALLQVQPEVDLVDVLEGRTHPADAVLHSEVDNLSALLLRSAPGPKLSAELLAGSTARRLLDELGSLFDLIIIDGGNMAESAVPRVLAAECSGVVLVIRAGTTRTAAWSAVKAIQSAGGRVLGAVFTED